MKVLFEYCQGCGKHPNEDVYGYTQNVLWVIDGATAVFADNYISNQGDVNWIVNEISKSLSKQNKTNSLIDMLEHSISEVREKALSIAPIINTISQNQLPTFAICIVRINKESLEYACLGDCSVILSSKPDKRYTDERILPFHLMVNEVKDKYKNDIVEYKKNVIKKIQEIKQYINTDGGYCIGTLDPKSALLAVTEEIPVSPGERVLLCSDGFQPNISEAKLIDYDHHDYFQPEKLNELIQTQRSSEKEYVKKSNIDISDDETVILFEV